MLERLSQDHVAEALSEVPARLPGRRRPRRHRRLQLRRGGADPRHPDRHRHVAPSSWAAYPEEGAGGPGRGGSMSEVDLCDWCEEVLQPYLDRDLSETERQQAKGHLADCTGARSATSSRATCAGSCARRSSSRWSRRSRLKLAEPPPRALDSFVGRGLNLSGRSSAKSTSPGGPRSSHGTRSAGQRARALVGDPLPDGLS